LRHYRDYSHPGISSRVIALISSLNDKYDQVLSVFMSPIMTELRTYADSAILHLQSAIQLLQWFLQVNSGVCSDYEPFSCPDDFESFVISIFIIAQSIHAQQLNFQVFPLSCFHHC
jgi:hypothetical protein